MLAAVSEPLMRPSLPVGRLLALGILVLATCACGRRGPLEAPPDPALRAAPAHAGVVATRPGRAPEGQANAPGQAGIAGGEAFDEPVVASPVPSPARPTARKRGYVVPKDPFILDPLL